jgi:hypothetical protein
MRPAVATQRLRLKAAWLHLQRGNQKNKKKDRELSFGMQ